MDLEQDHAEIAWGNWHGQFREGKSPRLEAFVKSLYKPTEDINRTLVALRDALWLQTAQGKQLDLIGEIVGLPREVAPVGLIQYFGFSDQDGMSGFDEGGPMYEGDDEVNPGLLPDQYYRQRLAWKIGINNGHGTRAELISSVKQIFGAGRVIVVDEGNASIRVSLDRVPYMSDALLRFGKEAVPKLAGVRLNAFDVGGERTFGFSDQDGFLGFSDDISGGGVMADQID